MRTQYSFGPIEIYWDAARPDGRYYARMKFWEVAKLPYRGNFEGAEREKRQNERTLEVILNGDGANKAREKMLKELRGRNIPVKRESLEVISHVPK